MVWAFLLLIVVGLIARPFMPQMIRWYVNRTLDESQLYRGKIGDIELSLWRGAYAIDDVRLSKISGDVPVPLFSGKRVEFALEWRSLMHGKLVGRLLLEEPELNFVDAPDPDDAQTGAGGPWLEMIRDLFPFKINSAQVRNGSVHFRTYQKKVPVDVYLTELDADVDNLTNIQNDTTSLVTTVTAHALAMEEAKFEFQMKLDPFSYKPTFHLATRLLGLDVTKINDLAMAYGAFNFKQGSFDLVIEAEAQEGQFKGYVKPLFRNLQVFRLGQDIQQDNPLQFFWQALVGGAATVLKNQSRDQVATSIPFTGSVDNPKAGVLTTVANLLRNAFIRAYLPRLENGQTGVEDMEFQPATFEDTLSGDGT
jgi:hypothetical protein